MRSKVKRPTRAKQKMAQKLGEQASFPALYAGRHTIVHIACQRLQFHNPPSCLHRLVMSQYSGLQQSIPQGVINGLEQNALSVELDTHRSLRRYGGLSIPAAASNVSSSYCELSGGEGF
jgi:hypothetical protein